MLNNTLDPLLAPVATEMRARLIAALDPTRLAIIDDSAAHQGHAGHSGSGESHFTVEIEAAAFANQSHVAKQRMVYDALGDLMERQIHALIIKASAA